MRTLLLFAAAVALGLAAPGPASAHPPGGHHGGHPQSGRYFGNGPHDAAPHWHKSLTPYGPIRWYGNGPHDVIPHRHRVTPWGGVTGYAPDPLGPTKSYNGFPRPFGYTPFGGYSGFGGDGAYGSPWMW